MADSVRRRVGEARDVGFSNSGTDSAENFSSGEDENALREGGQAAGNAYQNAVNNFGIFKIALIIGAGLIVFLLFRDQDSFLQAEESAGGPAASHDSQTGKTVVNGVTIYTKKELAKFSGANEKMPVLLAFMGKVYDVSKGRRHYAPGGSYQFFGGKDATRSFLTGDFKNDLNDNLDGIADSLYGEIESWENTYANSADYKQVGVLCGNFYQCVGDKEPGKPTAKLILAREMEKKAKATSAKDNEIYAEFPQCNSEWSQEKGGRVWCSEKSGGTDRKWAGFPRLFLHQKDGKKSTRCACVHPDKLSDPRLELYPSCRPDSDSCKLQQQQ